MTKVAAHQDTSNLEDGTVKDPKDISLHEWGNVRADAVVGEMAAERIQAEWELQDDRIWDSTKVSLTGPARSFI